jgi:hypothetical protein
MSRPAALPCLNLEGGPYQRGFALGRARAEAWRAAAERFSKAQSALSKSLKTLELNEIDGWNSTSILRDDERAFFLGLADGAGLSLDAVLALGLAQDEAQPGSFALLALGHATRSGEALLLLGLGGQDPGASFELSRHRVAQGLSYWILGRAGCLGGFWGENESGLLVYAVSFSPSRRRSAGLLSSLLVPRILQQAGDLQELRKIVARSPMRQGCLLIAYSKKEKQGLSIDLDGEAMALRSMRGKTNDCLALRAEGPPPSKPWEDFLVSEPRRVLEDEVAALSWPSSELAFKQLLRAAAREPSSLIMRLDFEADKVQTWLRADTLGDYELSEQRRAEINAAALSPGEWPLSRLRIDPKGSLGN